MKIISEISNEKVLVSLTKGELANLLGEYGEHQIKYDFLQNVIKKELDINVSDIYKKHRLINSLQKESDYYKARSKLESMLKALTPIENKIEALSKL